MNLQRIKCSQITADPANNVSRPFLTPENCEGLAAQISENGLESPVTVRHLGEPTMYSLAVGFRRFTAVSVNLGEEYIYAFVKDCTVEEGRKLNLAENIQRQDLTFWEQCCGIRGAYPNDLGRHTDIGREVGKSVTWVKKRASIWKLPEEILLQVEAGLLSPAQIDVILLQQTEAEQIQATKKLKAGEAAGQTVRDLQRSLTGRKNNRSKAQVKVVMSEIIKCGTPTSEAALHGMRFAIGEISDTLLYELLDKLREE